MSSKQPPLIGALLGLTLAANAAAAPLDLEQALERARAAAPEVQVAQRLLEEARASRVGQGVILPVNPRLFGDYRRLAVEQAGQPTDPRDGYNFGLDGRVEVSGASGTRLAEAERRVDLARTELEVEQARAAGRAYLSFVRTGLAASLVESVQEILAVEQRVLEATRERLALGVVGEPDLTLVTVEQASVEVELLEARRQVTAARLALAEVLNLPAAEVAELAPVPLDPPTPMPLEALVQRAVERRTDVRPLRAELELLRASRARLQREVIPQLGYNLGIDGAPASPAFAFVGLSVELPVAQRNQGALATTAARSATTETRLTTLLARVEKQVDRAYQSFETRRAQARVLETVAVPAARRNLELVEQGWRAGRFDLFRLTSATRESLRVRRELLTTLEAAWEDYIELELASGGLAP